jgi:hypothetical protein
MERCGIFNVLSKNYRHNRTGSPEHQSVSPPAIDQPKILDH